jgi:hypothetical protein
MPAPKPTKNPAFLQGPGFLLINTDRNEDYVFD